MKTFLFIMLFFPTNAFCGIKDTNYGTITIDEITSIYDGDTFRANINSWPDIIGKRSPIRIAGIDTPELRGKCETEKLLAREAKKFTVDKLRSGEKIELRDIKRGKYFRILASVFINDKSLGEALIEAGLAVRYEGGKKTNWCSP